jgi:hypothetical protein
MTVADITPYLIELERKGYNGNIILSYRNGEICSRVTKEITETVQTTEKGNHRK